MEGHLLCSAQCGMVMVGHLLCSTQCLLWSTWHHKLSFLLVAKAAHNPREHCIINWKVSRFAWWEIQSLAGLAFILWGQLLPLSLVAVLLKRLLGLYSTLHVCLSCWGLITHSKLLLPLHNIHEFQMMYRPASCVLFDGVGDLGCLLLGTNAANWGWWFASLLLLGNNCCLSHWCPLVITG